MFKTRLKILVGALLVGLLVMLPKAASAAQSERSQVADGMFVHLGVMSTAVMWKDPDLYSEHFTHGTPPAGKDMYHVLIALFDRSSGARITDAEVDMRVSPLGLAGRKKHLEPMGPGDLVCFCNYFRMPATDSYEIRVSIRRPGVPEVTRAKFIYRPVPGS
jgi:hypothetical protein